MLRFFKKRNKAKVPPKNSDIPFDNIAAASQGYAPTNSAGYLHSPPASGAPQSTRVSESYAGGNLPPPPSQKVQSLADQIPNEFHSHPNLPTLPQLKTKPASVIKSLLAIRQDQVNEDDSSSDEGVRRTAPTHKKASNREKPVSSAPQKAYKYSRDARSDSSSSSDADKRRPTHPSVSSALPQHYQITKFPLKQNPPNKPVSNKHEGTLSDRYTFKATKKAETFAQNESSSSDISERDKGEKTTKRNVMQSTRGHPLPKTFVIHKPSSSSSSNDSISTSNPTVQSTSKRTTLSKERLQKRHLSSTSDELLLPAKSTSKTVSARSAVNKNGMKKHNFSSSSDDSVIPIKIISKATPLRDTTKKNVVKRRSFSSSSDEPLLPIMRMAKQSSTAASTKRNVLQNSSLSSSSPSSSSSRDVIKFKSGNVTGYVKSSRKNRRKDSDRTSTSSSSFEAPRRVIEKVSQSFSSNLVGTVKERSRFSTQNEVEPVGLKKHQYNVPSKNRNGSYKTSRYSSVDPSENKRKPVHVNKEEPSLPKKVSTRSSNSTSSSNSTENYSTQRVNRLISPKTMASKKHSMRQTTSSSSSSSSDTPNRRSMGKKPNFSQVRSRKSNLNQESSSSSSSEHYVVRQNRESKGLHKATSSKKRGVAQRFSIDPNDAQTSDRHTNTARASRTTRKSNGRDQPSMKKVLVKGLPPGRPVTKTTDATRQNTFSSIDDLTFPGLENSSSTSEAYEKSAYPQRHRDSSNKQLRNSIKTRFSDQVDTRSNVQTSDEPVSKPMGKPSLHGIREEHNDGNNGLGVVPPTYTYDVLKASKPTHSNLSALSSDHVAQVSKTKKRTTSLLPLTSPTYDSNNSKSRDPGPSERSIKFSNNLKQKPLYTNSNSMTSSLGSSFSPGVRYEGKTIRISKNLMTTKADTVGESVDAERQRNQPRITLSRPSISSPTHDQYRQVHTVVSNKGEKRYSVHMRTPQLHSIRQQPRSSIQPSEEDTLRHQAFLYNTPVKESISKVSGHPIVSGKKRLTTAPHGNLWEYSGSRNFLSSPITQEIDNKSNIHLDKENRKEIYATQFPAYSSTKQGTEKAKNGILDGKWETTPSTTRRGSLPPEEHQPLKESNTIIAENSRIEALSSQSSSTSHTEQVLEESRNNVLYKGIDTKLSNSQNFSLSSTEHIPQTTPNASVKNKDKTTRSAKKNSLSSYASLDESRNLVPGILRSTPLSKQKQLSIERHTILTDETASRITSPQRKQSPNMSPAVVEIKNPVLSPGSHKVVQNDPAMVSNPSHSLIFDGKTYCLETTPPQTFDTMKTVQLIQNTMENIMKDYLNKSANQHCDAELRQHLDEMLQRAFNEFEDRARTAEENNAKLVLSLASDKVDNVLQKHYERLSSVTRTMAQDTKDEQKSTAVSVLDNSIHRFQDDQKKIFYDYLSNSTPKWATMMNDLKETINRNSQSIQTEIKDNLKDYIASMSRIALHMETLLTDQCERQRTSRDEDTKALMNTLRPFLLTELRAPEQTHAKEYNESLQCIKKEVKRKEKKIRMHEKAIHHLLDVNQIVKDELTKKTIREVELYKDLTASHMQHDELLKSLEKCVPLTRAREFAAQAIYKGCALEKMIKALFNIRRGQLQTVFYEILVAGFSTRHVPFLHRAYKVYVERHYHTCQKRDLGSFNVSYGKLSCIHLPHSAFVAYVHCSAQHLRVIAYGQPYCMSNISATCSTCNVHPLSCFNVKYCSSSLVSQAVCTPFLLRITCSILIAVARHI